MVLLQCKLLPLQIICHFSNESDMTHPRTKEVTLIARWDETENFGIVHLVKTEFEKLKENAGLHNRKHVDSKLI
jgi:hypothetical protein